LQGKENVLVKAEPLKSIVNDWQELLKTELTKKEKEMIQSHERTGRPLGDNGFLCRLEKMTNRILIKQKPGPKRKS
jgi:putative transposase